MPGNRLRVTLCAVTFLALTASARSEIIAPGTYRGYFTRTRWKQTVFHTGPYHLFVADSAQKTIKNAWNKPLEIEVTEMSQPINPGAGLIEKIGSVTESSAAAGLKLTAKLKASKVRQGEGIQLTLGLKNRADKSITIRASQLAVVLVTDSPFANSEINYKDPDDRSYWYYSYSHRSIGPEAHRRLNACREVIPPLTAKELVDDGQGMSLFNLNQDASARIVIAPGGSFSSKFVTGKELLPDDYEVFFLKSGNLSYAPGPMSKRHPFDVVK